MNVFTKGELSDYFQRLLAGAKGEMESEPDDKLLNMNPTQYVDYLVNRYSITPLQIDFDSITASDGERMIPAEMHPGHRFFVEAGESYKRQVITYHIPYAGPEELFNYRPSHRLLWSYDCHVDRTSISFDVINFSADAASIKREADDIIKNLRQQSTYVLTEIKSFNEQLRANVTKFYENRKQAILKRKNLMESLGVPLKKSTPPASYVVPIVKQQIVVKPTAPSTTFKPEPAVDTATYQQILQVLNDFGINMERLPSIYAGKGEEALRDLLIMQLSPHFQSVTGETFNKAGKTDILIRHDGHNVFVAECKFWRGAKVYAGTIDQALSYLTWRDSKAALIIFIDNAELEPVLQQIPELTKKHSCFVKELSKNSAGWFNYEMHLPNDPSRSVSMAVLCFHLNQKPSA